MMRPMPRREADTKEMPHYLVYEQRTPIPAGKDKDGEQLFAANLVIVAKITTEHYKRFDEACKHTRFPVIEEVQDANH
jgi:hypothetical protein